MARLRIAGIGAGYFSRFHLEGWRDVADAEVVAWCDRDRARAEALAREFGVARSFGDAAAMLDALDPDLVDIVTPPPAHAGLVALVHAHGLFVSMVIYKDLRLRDLPSLLLKAFTTSAVVMVVIGATGCLAWLITVEQVPQQIAGLVTHYATSQWTFLLLVNFTLLALGCFIEPVPALILAAPLLCRCRSPSTSTPCTSGSS